MNISVHQLGPVCSSRTIQDNIPRTFLPYCPWIWSAWSLYYPDPPALLGNIPNMVSFGHVASGDAFPQDTSLIHGAQLVDLTKYWSNLGEFLVFGICKPPVSFLSRRLLRSQSSFPILDCTFSRLDWQKSNTVRSVILMLTSSNENIFRVTGHFCGEFTGPPWIPRTKASDAELWCFHWCAHYDVIVMWGGTLGALRPSQRSTAA